MRCFESMQHCLAPEDLSRFTRLFTTADSPLICAEASSASASGSTAMHYVPVCCSRRHAVKGRHRTAGTGDGQDAGADSMSVLLQHAAHPRLKTSSASASEGRPLPSMLSCTSALSIFLVSARMYSWAR